jgi:hypothetical protein
MQKPANPNLYAMIVAQARAKYATYPSPGASNWVHKRYIELGGQFIETHEQDRRLKIAQKKYENAKRKHLSEKKDDKKGEKKKSAK